MLEGRVCGKGLLRRGFCADFFFVSWQLEWRSRLRMEITFDVRSGTF